MHIFVKVIEFSLKTESLDACILEKSPPHRHAVFLHNTLFATFLILTNNFIEELHGKIKKRPQKRIAQRIGKCLILAPIMI